MNTLYDTITKALIDLDLLVEDATAEEFRDILPVETVEKLDGYTESAIPSTETEEQGMDDTTPSVEDLQKRLDEVTAERDALLEAQGPDSDSDPIEKALTAGNLDPAVVEIIKADRERLAKAEEALHLERENRLNESFISKAADYDLVIDDPVEFGPALRRVAEIDPDAAELLVNTLDVAQERLSKSALFDTRGVNYDIPSDANDQVETIAKSLIDADPTLTVEEARAKVLDDNPALYDEIEQDRRAAIRDA